MRGTTMPRTLIHPWDKNGSADAGMDIVFKQKQLERLAFEPSVSDYSPPIVTAFIERLAIIRAAPDESVFEDLKFLRYRRMRGRGRRRAMQLVGSTDLLLQIHGNRASLTAMIEAIWQKRRSVA